MHVRTAREVKAPSTLQHRNTTTQPTMRPKKINIVAATLMDSPAVVTPYTVDRSTTIQQTARKKINTDPNTADPTLPPHTTTTIPVDLSVEEALVRSRSIQMDHPSHHHLHRQETMRQATRLSTTPKKATRFLRLSVTATTDHAEIMEVREKFTKVHEKVE